jgi:hypothetical protein
VTTVKTTAIRAPTDDPKTHTTALKQLKETTELALRLRGNPLDSFVRVRELVNAGLIRFENGHLYPPNSIQGSSLTPSVKGQLLTYSTVVTLLGVGADGTFLEADHTTATGLKWGSVVIPTTQFIKGGTWVAGSGAIDPAVTQDIPVIIPKDCTITSLVVMTIGGPGSCSIDIRRKQFASYPPGSGDSITGGHPAVISSGTTYTNTTFTGWTSTSLLQDDVIMFHLTSASTFTLISIQLRLQ